MILLIFKISFSEKCNECPYDSTCYRGQCKCPKECPSDYEPVCGPTFQALNLTSLDLSKLSMLQPARGRGAELALICVGVTRHRRDCCSQCLGRAQFKHFINTETEAAGR